MIDTAEIEKSIIPNRDLPAPLLPLQRLAANYWWSWSADGASIFRDLDADIWEECEHNPRQLLAKTSDYRLAQAATDPVYLERVRRIDQLFRDYMAKPSSWPKDGTPTITPDNPVAYFCAEFGVHNSLPLYSGGLGILAGDHLKSASDLNVPLIAIGLFYRFGYFRQRLRRDDWQEEEYRENHVDELALKSVDDEQGKALLVQVVMRGRTVSA